MGTFLEFYIHLKIQSLNFAEDQLSVCLIETPCVIRDQIIGLTKETENVIEFIH